MIEKNHKADINSTGFIFQSSGIWRWIAKFKFKLYKNISLSLCSSSTYWTDLEQLWLDLHTPIFSPIERIRCNSFVHGVNTSIWKVFQKFLTSYNVGIIWYDIIHSTLSSFLQVSCELKHQIWDFLFKGGLPGIDVCVNTTTSLMFNSLMSVVSRQFDLYIFCLKVFYKRH